MTTQNYENDLAILHPDRVQTIAGVRVTMREYGFVEGMQLSHLVEPVATALSDAASTGELLTPGALRPVFAGHLAAVTTLIATACDQPEAWVRGLNDADGQALILLWWVTNADFFVRRVIEAITARQMETASAGQTPTPLSPGPAMTPAESASTRTVN
jgi:hypothetical protein